MKQLKKLMAVLLALSLLCGIFVTVATAVAEGDSYAPNMDNWGIQNNNGWYYLYQDTSGNYHELDFYDATAAIPWQQNNFAFDPNVMNEMLFISKTQAFTGELGSKPVYGYQVPESGKVELSFRTHGQSTMQVTALKGSSQLTTITPNTTGPLGGFTMQTVTADVAAGDWLYIVISATAADREIWIDTFNVKYLSVGEGGETEEPTEPPIDPNVTVYAPNMDNWGTQGNNGWYYLYRDTSGGYHELDYYDATATIPWQQNNFAFDPNVMGEMLFISKTSCFTGELGSVPAYGFKAPLSGEVQLTFRTHGQSSLRVTVLKGGSELASITPNTTGADGGFTAQTVTANVSAGDWLYIVISATGADRELWIDSFKAEYLSTGEQPEDPEDPEQPEDPEDPRELPAYAPDLNAWGSQGNNGWYYMYRATDGSYHELDFYGADAPIAWQQNNFAFDPNVMGEMLFISKTQAFTGELGSLPVIAYQAQHMGQVQLTFRTHGQSTLRVTVLQGDTELTAITPNTNGFTNQTVTANVNQGDMLYIVISATGADRELWIDSFKAQYLAVDEQPELPDQPDDPDKPDQPDEPDDPILPENPEDPEPIVPEVGTTCAPDMGHWGCGNNNGWHYMYKNVGGQYLPLDYYGADAAIAWQRNAYAFDPAVMNEMLFINRTQCFTGENGSKPVYAYQAQRGGQVELSVSTHGQNSMQMEIFKNSELLKTVSFTTEGPDAGYATTKLTVDVKEGTWIYLVISASGADREAWVKDYSVTYLSVNDEKEEISDQLIYTPDTKAWGTQGNNGWYYLYKGADNVYNQLTYWDSSAAIEWQRDAFASNPDEDQEMYFIARQKFFFGELATSPVYGFLCPVGGQVRLTFVTHGPSELSMTLSQNKTVVDTFSLSTDGLEAGYTKHEYILDVKQGTWLYMEADGTTQVREGFVSYYGVEYLSTNDLVEEEDNSIVGTVYTPDLDVMKQNNNGWYYMYYDNMTCRYENLDYYGGGASIDWQRNAFAFDPFLMGEMLFMKNDRFFVGENGSCPVYAFKCPSGGTVRLKIRTHGREDIYTSVYHNGYYKDSFSYNTTGQYNGFTEHTLELEVKKGDFIYLYCGTRGVNREGWISFYGVEYLTENDQEGGYGQAHVYMPDMDDWGKQDNNHWSFAYLDKDDGFFRRLAFVRSDNNFQGTADGGYEYLLIKELEMHPAVKGSPAKVFTCPSGGKLRISFQAWMQAAQNSLTGTGIAVYHNGEKIWPENEDWYQLDNSVTIKHITVEVAQGDDLAIVVDAINANNSFDATNVRVCARYNSYNDAVRTQWPEYPQEATGDNTPDVPDVPDIPVTEAPTESTEAPTEPTEESTEPSTQGTEGEGDKGAPWLWIGLGGGGALLAAAAALFFLKKKKKGK